VTIVTTLKLSGDGNEEFIMGKQIYYFEKFKTWDLITIVSYILISIIVYFNCTLQDFSVLHMYAFVTQFFLITFNYKSLRNLSVYIIWVAIGVIHFIVYIKLVDLPDLVGKHDHSAKTLKNTLIILGYYQVVRFISARTQGQEWVCPGGSFRYDFFDNRKITIIDRVLAASYLGLFLILLFN